MVLQERIVFFMNRKQVKAYSMNTKGPLSGLFAQDGAFLGILLMVMMRMAEGPKIKKVIVSRCSILVINPGTLTLLVSITSCVVLG